MKIISIIFTVLLVAFISIFSVYLFIPSPECGNGILEKGETSYNCCLDAGCAGEQSCENNFCVEPI